MSGYCTVTDVTSAFPTFKIDAPGGVSRDDIQGWINDRKARIRSAFLTRGFDPDNPPNGPLTEDQTGFLKSLNRDGAIADLGDALQGTVTLQPGEYNLPAARRKSFELVIKEIKDALHDVLFNTGPKGQVARHQDVSPLFRGVGGAETNPADTPRVLGTNVFFGKNDRF